MVKEGMDVVDAIANCEVDAEQSVFAEADYTGYYRKDNGRYQRR